MRLGVLDKLKGKGDQLADAALADYQQAQPSTRGLLEHAMRHGVSNTNSMPESFRQLLLDSEAAVAAVPAEQSDLAMQPYSWIGPVWISIALGPGSLAHTYSDPGIAAVLVRTGNLLSQSVSRRLLETQLWKISVIKPGGMGVGNPGYVHTLQVRMLHARVRASLSQRGWTGSDSLQSVPIDQYQLLRTWLDFTVVPLEALERIGFSFSAQEKQRLYGAWRLIGHLLGVDTSVLVEVTDHAKALELLGIVDSQLPPPDDNSRTLTMAMIDAIGNRLAPILKLPTDVAVMLMGSLCRLFHGDEIADRLSVELNWTSALLPMMADANRFRMTRIIEEPAYRQAVQQQSLRAFEAIEKGSPDATAFQLMSASCTSDDLPKL